MKRKNIVIIYGKMMSSIGPFISYSFIYENNSKLVIPGIGNGNGTFRPLKENFVTNISYGILSLHQH